MTGLETFTALASLALTGGCMAYLYHVVQKVPHSFADPDQAERARQAAPYHRLGNVMSMRDKAVR